MVSLKNVQRGVAAPCRATALSASLRLALDMLKRSFEMIGM
jgi:hypothetical protein